jgi:hypothetical protein
MFRPARAEDSCALAGRANSETQGVALGWSAAVPSAPKSKLPKSDFISCDRWPFVR